MENHFDDHMLVRFATTELNDTLEIKSETRRLGKNADVYVVSVPTIMTKQTSYLHANHISDGKRNVASKDVNRKIGVSNGFPEKANKIDSKFDIIVGHYYDPHEHNPGTHPTTFLETMFLLLKANLGTGVLAMPNAFSKAGWLLGIVGTIIIGFLCTYTVHLLVSAEYELCKRRRVPSMTFPEIVEGAFQEGPRPLRWFAPCGKALTNFFILTYQVGSSSIYVVFMASNFKQVYDTCTEGDINIRLMIAYMLVPLILICWVRDLKLLAPFSTAATAVLCVSFVLLSLYLFEEVPTLDNREPVGSISNLPFFFSTVLFAMEAIGTIIPLKNTMKKPKTFGGCCGVLNVSMVPTVLLYTCIGFFGYIKYGPATAGSITLNLPQHDMLASVVKMLFSVSIYISYAIYNFIVLDILWTNGVKKKFVKIQNELFWEYSMRTGIVLFTCVMAIAIPNLELFISLIGAFSLSALGIALPAIVQTLTQWDDRGLQFAVLALKNVILLLIAVAAFIIGVSMTIMQYFEVTF